MDKFFFTFFFLGLGLILLVLGYNYKKWKLYYKLNPNKQLAKMFKEVLGEGGMKYYMILISFLFISIGLYLAYISYIRPILPDRYSKKVDEITLSKKGGISLFTTIKKIEKSEYYRIDNFDKLSLSNNYVESIPKFVWEIKSLEVLNLENNLIEKISIENLKRSNIKEIVISGNPISEEEIQKIRNLKINLINKKK